MPLVAEIGHLLRWRTNEELSFQEPLLLLLRATLAWTGTGCQRYICSGETLVMTQGYQRRTGIE